MTTYESNIKTISSSEEVVFGILSNLNNLEEFTKNEQLSDKLKDVTFDADSCSFIVDGFGKVGFKIIEKVPFKTIKFATEHVPVEVNAWIQLKQVDEMDTRMKLTIKAELPAMIKMMVNKKIEEGINSIADLLAKALNSKLN